VREAGARNVVIAEGIRCGKWLTRVPPLNDPLNQIAYAVHPYQLRQGLPRSNVDMYTAQDFDRNFGIWQARGHPIIATEWNMWKRPCHDGSDGNPTSPQIVVNLLTYLRDHNIGLVIWAFDLKGTVWADRDWQVPMRLEPFDGCGGPMGAGAMVRDYFQTGRIAAQ
jgi:endoglucanase